MAKRGPRPDPHSANTARGRNSHGQRLKADPSLGRPIRPQWLTGEAAKFWKQHAAKLTERGWLTAIDSAAFARLCSLWQRIRECDATLDRDGITTETATGGLKSHPCVGQRAEAERQFFQLAAKFNLTPADRLRNGEAEHESQTDDDLAKKYLA